MKQNLPTQFTHEGDLLTQVYVKDDIFIYKRTNDNYVYPYYEVVVGVPVKQNDKYVYIYPDDKYFYDYTMLPDPDYDITNIDYKVHGFCISSGDYDYKKQIKAAMLYLAEVHKKDIKKMRK